MPSARIVTNVCAVVLIDRWILGWALAGCKVDLRLNGFPAASIPAMKGPAPQSVRGIGYPANKKGTCPVTRARSCWAILFLLLLPLAGCPTTEERRDGEHRHDDSHPH